MQDRSAIINIWHLASAQTIVEHTFSVVEYFLSVILSNRLAHSVTPYSYQRSTNADITGHIKKVLSRFVIIR